MTYFCATWITYLLFLFSVTFAQSDEKRSLFSGLNKAYFVVQIVFSLISFTTIFVSRVTIESWGSNPMLGPFFNLFLVYLLLTLFGGLIVFLRKFRRNSGLLRIQLGYVLLGFGLSAISAITVSTIIPLFTSSAQYTKLSPLGLIFLIGFISIAIVKHRLLDIRVVITRSLIFGILVTLVALAFVLITFFSAQFFGDTPSSRIAISFIVAVIIVAGLDPLKRLLSRATDKVFFKARIDYGAALRQLTEVTSVELNLGRLVQNLTAALQEQLKLKFSLIPLRRSKGNGDVFETPGLEGRSPLRLPANHVLIKHLKIHQHASVLEVLERKIDDARDPAERKQLEQSRQVFEQLGAAVIAPIVAQGQLNALLVLGPKLSGESFSGEDLQLIEVLGPQVGSAIQKANLYEEVRAFGERLKRKVEEATAELKERNVSLLTLQQITRQITRSLDFNRVVQQIADSVAKELGHVGAVLVFVDDDGHTVRARAITNTPLTNKALKLLPKPFTEYTTDLTNDQHKNLAHEVIRTGQVRFTERFAEVISPPVPVPIATAVQKLVGVKTIVVMPIMTEEKTIGVIEIGLKKPQEAVTERELETMQSVADQLGLVARNLKLFEQLKQANSELEDANLHLQQLDQAKSEFVSIASHQLRTPMTGIRGYLSMLTAGDFGALKVEHHRILRSLLLESERMIRLINLFLNVSKIEAGRLEIHPQPTDLIPTLELYLHEVKKLADDKKLSLTLVKPAKPLPKALADADKLHEVVINLIDNAIKYTTEGSVTVSVEAGPADITVTVADTGVGIPPDQVQNLFNKFVRGSGIARIHPDGSGLGLFIAKRIVEGHRGHIWVESAGEGKGSRFRFTLPIA